MGTVLLNKGEDEFWHTTPRSLFASWEIHKKVNGLDNATPDRVAAPAGYIDQFI
ncbi:hypothetical protein M5X00_31170 [Paenibacillus alvei]|uniref:Uncharacterized protein n=1 Tax=Paenibacillus alvei TaxID=44250 RepID=A0ABT4H820_PAEAL|nr:hypothetical protein [Paenibacillus alvei]MCY9544689.1 hypothetical protein [Paenibacillus alvei]MCY9708232.1 hypothetical protein [Paenibacillus alvei]MCY9738218.1 hypothetical protein [Paenibacillus alvei]MCY9758684.1 hypothetical protein [Paenibacillus alvei]MCY9764766.1 hypothetical protein [Paenibacillus alvei]